MTRIAINGACGRMAGMVLSHAQNDDNLEVVSAIDAPNSPSIGKDIGDVLGIGNIGVFVVSGDTIDSEIKEKKPDILIDFTTPKVSIKTAEIAAANNVKVIIGTTGFAGEELKELEKIITDSGIAGIIASNFSVGVNVFFKLAEDAAKGLKGFDIELIEAHHRFKKDAPSGTAKTLAKIVAEARGRNLDDVAVYGREGMVGERTPEEIGIHAIRAGDIVGDHTLLFGALGERIEIRHQAHSRDCFASGCVLATKWLAGKESGLYDMWDVIGLKD